ncbi:MAG: alanine/glycine:cation symporter family protein [Bacteroidota bacterium]|jgi:AGCS family alanine or glycine:cation symporter|nr:alanine/glycine:cation symporter family protein [Bacteroidota bacterium]|tara:strand:+ start:129 stop:1472 length:1344 start_codon:yes stop_codon:yes gene_type:complete
MIDLEIIENLINEIIEPLNWTIVFIIIGGGIYLTIISRANPLFRIISGFKLMLKKDQSSVGISRFQALSAVLAATVGLGNISGVALAIHQGGPGVLFWMWITALFGAIIKFFSCSLAISLRDKDEKGNYLAGPMYYMKSGIKKWGRTLAIWFSIAGLVGVLPAFTANQLTQSYITVLDPDAIYALGDTNWKLIIGIIFTILTSVVIFGGLKSIVRTTSGLVPVMVLLYFALGLFIIISNISVVPSTFALIFSEAFNFNTMMQGGFWALLLIGVRRAVFSSESGVGLAPIYHGQSTTKKGTDEGLVAMLGPILDTILVCTITGLIILISKADFINLKGIDLTLEAFRVLFFGYGNYLLIIMISVFGISTLFTYSYYGVRCFGFLTTPTKGKYYNLVYVVAIIISSILTIDIVLGLIDIAFALMVIPNMIAIIYLSKVVTKEMKERSWI